MNLKSFVILPLYLSLTFTPPLAQFSFFDFSWLFDLFFSKSDAGVFISYDRGESFQHKVFISNKRTIANFDILTIKSDPKNDKIIYLGTKGNGLWKSLDGGEVWYQIIDKNRRLDSRANVYDVAIDPQDSNNIYAGVYSGYYGRFLKSQDAGRSWQETYTTSRQKYAVFGAEIDQFNPSIIYMATAEGGVLKSADYGQSWRVVKWFSKAILDIQIDPRNNQIIYIIIDGNGLYKTIDGGANWQNLKKNFNQGTLILNQENSDVIYLGLEDGLSKSLDGGASWQAVNIIIPANALPILSAAIDPKDSNRIYYGAGSVIYRSLDGGRNWNLQTLPTSKLIKVLYIAENEPNIVYIGISK